MVSFVNCRLMHSLHICIVYMSHLFERLIVFVEIKGAGKALSCDVAPERTGILLEIPANQRSVSSLLTEGNFRPSRLWRWSTLNRSRAPYPHVKDFLSYI